MQRVLISLYTGTCKLNCSNCFEVLTATKNDDDNTSEFFMKDLVKNRDKYKKI